MPFSIRRLAHLNRSQSMQSRKDGSSKIHSSDVPAADGTAVNTTTTSSSSRSTDQQQTPASASAKSSKSMGSKSSKSKSSKGHKAGSSDSAAAASAASSAGARGEVDQLVAIANNFNQHYKELEQQRQQQQQQLQQQQQQHSAYIASHHGAPQPSLQHQHGVPPSFVIRNQTTIQGSAFQPVHQSAQQSSHHHALTSSAKSYEPVLPSSRSLDSNEIRRFNAVVAASAAANQSNPPSYQESTTLRDWSRGQQSNRAVMSDGEQEPQMGGGRGGQMTTSGSSATSTKRVHYAATTFTRASSLSGHMPTSGQQHHHHTLAHQSASEENAGGGGGVGPPPSISSRSSRMVLARQTSVSTPTGSTTMASSLLKNAALQQQQSSSAGNGQAAAGLPLNLPRGGEEVLINGGGHPRGRSSSKPTSAAANHHRHYAKQLFTSSSIDVVMTDSNAEGTQQSGAKGSAAAHIKMDEQSSRNNRSSQKQPPGKPENVSSNQPDSAPNRPSKGVSQQQHQQQQQSGGIAVGSSATIPHRPSSTTPLDRNFYAIQANQASLFDDDPGIMSEIETSATGFRRGNKVRSSLPIVRTPSKSQDRSLGLVFLQFRSETKRALLPNEITSIDTVKALFVRSFPRQLTMEYLDHPSVRIYIHDASKDMFYELEDLRDVKDRVILRIYEQGVNGPQPGGGGLPIAFQNQSVPPEPGENYGYFSEPEFDSEFQSQHVHRKRFPPPPPMQISQQQPHLLVGPNGPVAQSQYYGTIMLPPQYRSATLGIRPGFIASGTLPGQPLPQPPTRNKAYPGYSQTLPRGTHLMSPTSITALNSPFGIPTGNQPTPPKPTRSFAPSPGPPPPQAAGLIVIQGHHPRPPALPPGSMAPSSASVHQHLAQQYHQSRPLPDRPYSVAGHYPSPDRMGARPIPYPAGSNPADFSGYLSSPEHRPSAAMMALHAGQAQARSSFSGYPSSRPFDAEMAAGMAAAAAAAAAGVYPHPAAVYATRPPPPGAPPIDEEARIRMQEMERQIASLTNVVSKALGSSKPGSKPPPPPKPPSLISGYRSDINSTLSSDSATQLKQIRRRARDLRNEVRALKRFALQQTNTTRESLKETCNKIKSTLSFLSSTSDIHLRMERLVVSTDRDSYNDDVIRLDKDLLDLETNVEELRSNVINRRCRVNMSNVESMALTLSRASKTVADLKSRYPVLAQNLKTIMAKELQQIEREEKFLKEEPERLEHSLKRCKKLTGTLVTLKRLASVQEQRSSNNPNTCSPSQLLQAVEKKDISMDEGFVGTGGNDGLMSRAKRMQAWRRSAHFRQHIPNNYKIDLCRGFASMPTIQEPNIDESIDGEKIDDGEDGIETSGQNEDATGGRKAGTFSNGSVRGGGRGASFDSGGGGGSGGRTRRTDPSGTFAKHSLMTKSYDADLMEPHTVIHVTPATPSSTDSSKTSATASNMLENLLDELQTFSKQSSMDSPSSGTVIPAVHQRTSLRTAVNSNAKQALLLNQSDTVVRKARSKSYSSLRANSEPPGTRARGASIPDGTIDLDSIAMLAAKCGNTAAATAALMEKRFAQSRQELLEQRHQELLRKQRQLQEQYTRLQQLSRGQIPRGFLNDLKKTGSESNLAAKAATMSIVTSGGGGAAASGSSNVALSSVQMSRGGRVPISSTVHGSLKNLANNPNSTSTSSTGAKAGSASRQNGSAGGTAAASQSSNEAAVTKKIFETEIL